MSGSKKILRGGKMLSQFLHDLDESTLRNLLNEGLPHTKINGRIYAHADNVEKWFENRTKGGRKVEKKERLDK